MEKFANLSENDFKKLMVENPLEFDSLCEEARNAPQWFYTFVIQLFTSIDFEENEAKKHFQAILSHKKKLAATLGRNAGLQVAMLDYFLNISKHLNSPKAVEIAAFEEILNMTKIDSKTGCYNYGFFREMLDVELKRADRYEHSSSVILIDLDDFKQINDKYGHLFADTILEKMVMVIKASLRKEDIVARYGGDEFVILLPHSGRVGARFMGERLKSNIIEYFSDKTFEGEPLTVTFSAGIATFPMDASNADLLLQCADNALYRSKKRGKNCIYDYLEEENIKSTATESNRRKHPRRYLEVNNTVDINDESSLVAIDGKILNISEGGALLECTCALDKKAVEKKVALHFKELSNFNGMNIQGDIVRINKEHQNLKFHLGIQFSKPIDTHQWKKFQKQTAPAML